MLVVPILGFNYFHLQYKELDEIKDQKKVLPASQLKLTGFDAAKLNRIF
jgi:hypothetical protein